jgi:hypothetical protein
MFEYRHKNRKYIIIEVADIFYAQNKAEEIPDETLQPDEYKAWEKVEDRAARKVIRRIIQKAKKENFVLKRLLNNQQADQIAKKPLSLGLNGVYLLIFVDRGAR